MYDERTDGLILIGSGFLAAIGFGLGIHGILVIKGLSDATNYGLIFGLIFLGVVIGMIIALFYAAMEDEWIVTGWVYLILIIIFGILGFIVAVNI